MRKSENIRELEYLASSQWGMFTSAQARALGVRGTQVSRMADAGAVEAMRRGVYRYTVGEETSHPYMKAAWLAAYPASAAAERLKARPLDAVVAGHTASALHGIGDLHEDPYTFIVRARRQTSVADLEFHTWPLEENDVTFVEGLPVTTMERTIVDLVRERRDPGHVRQAVTDAFDRGVDAARLGALLGGLGASYAAAVEDLRPLIERLAADEDVSALVVAMRELEAWALETGRRFYVPNDGGTVDDMRSALSRIEVAASRIEAASNRETMMEVARASRDLVEAFRAMLSSDKGLDAAE